MIVFNVLSSQFLDLLLTKDVDHMRLSESGSLQILNRTKAIDDLPRARLW